jgi:hypothetical protein
MLQVPATAAKDDGEIGIAWHIARVKPLARLPKAKMAVREIQPKARRLAHRGDILYDWGKKLIRPHTAGGLGTSGIAWKTGLLGGF